MESDLYTKPVDQLMMEREISLSYRPDKNNYNPWWQAWILHPNRAGYGPTPRDAIIDLYKNQTK